MAVEPHSAAVPAVRHTPNGRRVLGAALACSAAVQWGTQPVILKLLMNPLDVYSLAWIRFLVSSLLLVPIVIRGQGFGPLLRLRGWPLILLSLCVIGLLGNYLTFMLALDFISPAAAQVLIQLGPMLVLLGGLVLFSESLSGLQWAGLGVLVSGLALFFSPRFDELFNTFESFGAGVLLLVLSATLWAVYMLTQKQLLTVLRPETVLFVIFASGTVALAPVADTALYASLAPVYTELLAISCLVTVASYFSYAKSLEQIEVSRIGVILALSPLVAFAATALFAKLLPTLIQPETLTPASICGAVLVIAGSILGALGSRRT